MANVILNMILFSEPRLDAFAFANEKFDIEKGFLFYMAKSFPFSFFAEAYENDEVIPDVGNKVRASVPHSTLDVQTFTVSPTSANTNCDAIRSGFTGRRSEVLAWLGNQKNVRVIDY